ncbi:MAG: hypothetical protein IT179_07885 [Acidobacteria bacterium]|nr:hypothetical protein [Acidobacteriota bacterium]
MSHNPVHPDGLQAPATDLDAKVQAALGFIVRAESGLLPELPRLVYPSVRFRVVDNRLIVQPRPADTVIRREYREFLREHLAELKEVCRARQAAPTPPAPGESGPEERSSGPESVQVQDSRPGSRITSGQESDNESRAPITSASDWRKTQIGGSDRFSPPKYGPHLGDPSTPNPEPRTAPTKEPDPVVIVQGYRLTDRDVRAMLSTFGDEALAEYEQGHLTKSAAYRQAERFYTHSLRMGIQVALRSSSGHVFLYPELKILRPPRKPSTDF